MDFLEVTGISVGGGDNGVLSNISLSQQVFQNIAIAGETGSGKSTLLKVIAGLVQPAAGNVFFEGERVQGPAEKLVPGHTGIAYLSQHFELPHSLRVEQVLKYVNTMSGREAEELYEICRISHLLKRRTSELSGGERQRIALARLLSTSPRLLLLDEPFSNLDMVHKNVLKAVIQDISRELEITCILISHDPYDTLSWADQILVMKEGKIVQQGAPEQIYRQPVNEYVAGLFGKYNLLTKEILSNLAGSKEEHETVVVRPEDIKVVSDKKQAVPGKVQQVKFFGSYSELEVLVANSSVNVRITEGIYKKGDIVYISLPSDLKKYAL